MNKEKLKQIIEVAKANGDIETLNKIKAKLAEVQQKKSERENFIAPTRRPVDQGGKLYTVDDDGKKVSIPQPMNANIKRENKWVDIGEGRNPEDQKLYVEPLTQRTRRQAFEMINTQCNQCKRDCVVHPADYAQRKEREEGSYVCDQCISRRYRG